MCWGDFCVCPISLDDCLVESVMGVIQKYSFQKYAIFSYVIHSIIYAILFNKICFTRSLYFVMWVAALSFISFWVSIIFVYLLLVLCFFSVAEVFIENDIIFYTSDVNSCLFVWCLDLCCVWFAVIYIKSVWFDFCEITFKWCREYRLQWQKG